MQFEQLITASNIKFVENRMLVNKNFGISVFVKTNDNFSSVQTIQGVDSEVFDCNGTRLVFFASSNEVHCYGWNGSEYVYVDNIINDVAGHSFGDYIAIEGNRVALSLKDLSNSEVTIKYYDLLEESATTDVLDVISPVTLESSLKGLNNNFGWDVSISGDDNMIAVGEPNGETNLIDTVFSENKILASDRYRSDYFGDSVAIDGNRIVVGAYGDNGDANTQPEQGSAYVYEYNGSSWIEKQKLEASDGVANDRFGDSVAIDGNTIVVGAHRDDDKGSAYVFELSNGSWIQKQKLVASDGVSSDMFGDSVAIDGNRIVVGAQADDSAKGSVYVFEYNGSSWIEKQKLIASDGATYDRFGESVAIDGNRIVVGAGRDDNFKGSAYVFEYNGSSWIEKQKLTASDGVISDWFGSAVAIDGNRIVVGAWLEDINNNSYATNEGSAYVFEYNGSSWVQKQKLVSPERSAGDYFGYSVAIDGDIIVIGGANFYYERGVHVFEYNGSSWVLSKNIIPSDTDVYDYFGSAVAIDGNRIVVGAYGDDTNVQNSGSVYIFDTVYETLPLGSTGGLLIAPQNIGKVTYFQKTAFGYSPAGEIISPKLQTTGSFGGQISMSPDGSLVAVSEIYDDFKGEVHIYNLGPARYRYAYTIAQPADANGFFGWDVSLSNDLIAISSFEHIFIYNISQDGANILQEINVPNALSTLSLIQNTLIVNSKDNTSNLVTQKAFSFNGMIFQEVPITISGAPDEMGKISLSKDEQHLVSTSDDKVYIFKDNGSLQFELIKTIEKNGELPAGVEFGGNKLILGYPFETFFSGDIGYGEAGRAYLYDITTRQEVSFYDAFTYKGTLSDIFYPTNESDLLEMHNNDIYINSGVAPGNAKVSHFEWNGTSYSIKQVIDSENTPDFASEYKLNNDASKILISLTNSAGQKQIDEYVWNGTEYVYERSVKPAGNTTFVIDDGRVITGEITSVDVDGVQTPQGNMQVFVQKPQLVESGDSGSGTTISVENFDEAEGAEYTQVRIHLGVPYEKYIDDNGFVIHEKLPDITTENFLNDIEDVRDLYVNFDSEEIVRTSQSDTIHIYDIMLGQTVSGKYRLYLNSDPYIEVILYVSGGGSSYAQGIADRYVTAGLKMNVKYPSPNIKMERNTIPRLKSVTFE